MLLPRHILLTVHLCAKYFQNLGNIQQHSPLPLYLHQGQFPSGYAKMSTVSRHCQHHPVCAWDFMDLQQLRDSFSLSREFTEKSGLQFRNSEKQKCS